MEIHFETPGEDVTQRLISSLGSLGVSDTAYVIFEPGTFYISNAIMAYCNIIMTGAGRSLTKIICQSSAVFDHNDTYLMFNGSFNNEISVSISNVEVCLSDHTGIFWTEHERHLIKIIHSNAVNIHNVKMYSYNAALTLLDMRVCSNVFISDNVLINYNNCGSGGNVWMRRDTHNVTIVRNQIIKYGNDEALAFWISGDNDDPNSSPTSGIKENIIVADNHILYHKPSWGDGTIICTILLTVYNWFDVRDPQAPITFKDIHFTNNDITIDAPISGLFSFHYKPNDSHQKIDIVRNKVLSTTNNCATSSAYHMITVTDEAYGDDAIQIVDNSFTTEAITIGPDSEARTLFLRSESGKVLAIGNTYIGPNYVVDNYRYGTKLYWPSGPNNYLYLFNNHFAGLKMIGQFSGPIINDVTIVAEKNIFSGDTRIYCTSVAIANLSFNNNTFLSDCYEMLLQEFAAQGKLIFTNNNVTIFFTNNQGVHEGRLFAHYESYPLSSMYFERFEVTGNTVQGTTASTWIMSGLNCGTYIVNSNSFINP